MPQTAGPRALWRGVLMLPGPEGAGFHAAVKLYAAARPERVTFHLLHAADGGRLRQRMYCGLENQPVESAHVLKGYPVAEHEYVLMPAEELAALQPEQDRSIRIEAFVSHAALDFRYYERHYHLLPEKESRAYEALRRALEAAGCLALCQWSMRRRPYFGALRSHAGRLLLASLRYPQELIPEADFPLPRAEVTDQEVTTAKYLIQTLARDFAAEGWNNQYQARLRELIGRKLRGETVTTAPAAQPPPTPDTQLLAALLASVSAARARKAGA